MCPGESKASNHHASSAVLFWMQKCQSGCEEWLCKMMHLKEKDKKTQTCFQRVNIFGWKNFPLFSKMPDLFSCAHRLLRRVPSRQHATMQLSERCPILMEQFQESVLPPRLSFGAGRGRAAARRRLQLCLLPPGEPPAGCVLSTALVQTRNPVDSGWIACVHMKICIGRKEKTAFSSTG